MKIQSTPLTLIDQTDARKLEVYIKSNLPTVQIYNANEPASEAFTPDWTKGTGLTLVADVFLDSRIMTDAEYKQTTIRWYRDETVIAEGVKTFSVKNNVLSNIAIITYVCEVTYQGIVASARLTFNRVDAGLNGKTGDSAPAVQAQYSTDGRAGWTNILDPSIHKYVQYSYDGGVTYTNAIKMVGEDGTSVVIKGTAYTTDPLVEGQIVRLYDISNSLIDTNGLLTGDSYLVNGYLCVYNVNNNNFICAGTIQGPQGTPGQSSYVFIRYATSANGNGMSDKPDGMTYIGVCVLNKNEAPSSASSYTWSKFVGDSAKSIVLSGESQVFRVSKSNEYTPATIKVKATEINTSAITWEYSPDGGQTWYSTLAGVTFDNAKKTVTITGSLLVTNSIVVRASDGVISDVFTVYKAFDGADGAKGTDGQSAPIAFLTNENISFAANASGEVPLTQITTNVVAYIGTKKVMPVVGTISLSELPSGMTVSVDKTTLAESNEVILTLSVAARSTLGSTSSLNGSISIPISSPISTNLKLNWSKINAGAKGDQGIQGDKGDTGESSYFHIKYSANPDGNPMSEEPSTYIGTYVDNKANDSDDYLKYTWSRFVGSQGEKGDRGIAGTNGENGMTSYLHIAYATSSNGSTGFSVGDPKDKTYIGQYTDHTEADSADPTKYKWTLIKGDKGTAGADAYTVLLTNESHVFAGTTSSAVASSATTQILAYKGTAAQSITIVSVNGVAAATASTATGIAGLSFACSALSGASPTITFTCTTSFVSPSGTIPIVISVGGISITKMFTYSIAFKGATGGTGSVGPASSSYWLVSNASAVQKTSSGDILCTPATLTFTGRIQTGTNAPTNYAARWILAYSTDGSTYTDSYTSTANEATASITASATYKAVRARMYLAGGTTTLLDEQIIPFVSDGEVGPIGPTGDDAVTFQIYSSNGYALSTSVPTITLQTFAYIGDVEITAGATFQWYRHNGTDWVTISGATNSYLSVSRDDVSFSNNYRCIMQFNNTEYVGVVTIDDKNDENRVFASKPTTYFAGDLWIVGTDYIPSSFTLGTMLRAEHTNSSYADSDWVAATKYDDEIDRLTKTVGEYEQYFSVDSTNGLKVGDASINDNLLKVDRIETTSVNAREIKVESPLTVTGKYSGSTMLQAPILNLGNFSLVIESNGSLSVVANT